MNRQKERSKKAVFAAPCRGGGTVDAAASKAAVRKDVRVRFPLPVLMGRIVQAQAGRRLSGVGPLRFLEQCALRAYDGVLPYGAVRL